MSTPHSITCGSSRRRWTIRKSPLKALTSSGLDAAKLFARAQEPEVKAKLIENTQAAVERGAFGSPTFFVGKEMFFGKEQLREVEEMVSGK